MPTWVLACSALLLGCGSSTGSETELAWAPLVQAEGWQPAPAGTDPLAGDVSTDAIVCGEQDWHAELDGLEVQTTRCNYATVRQPLLLELKKGARLRVRVWWQALVSPEPVQGHMALLVGEHQVWEERIKIPGPADTREVELSSPLAASAGTPVTFHLHNHGSNTWNLNGFALQVPAADAQTEE